MTTILFDPSVFRAQAPQFANTAIYPDAQIQAQWNLATSYISDSRVVGAWERISAGQQVSALNLMTAHLMSLNLAIASGQPAGVVQGASIDKISVQMVPPPDLNGWRWWLCQTPYGQQLVALLEVAAVGGRFVSAGAPVLAAFRR